MCIRDSYGSIANISIGKLFIAGIGPGVLLCVAMMILVHFISKKRGYKPHAHRASDHETGSS